MDQSLIWSGINYRAILSLYNEDKREAVTEREKLCKPNLPISSCMYLPDHPDHLHHLVTAHWSPDVQTYCCKTCGMNGTLVSI